MKSLDGYAQEIDGIMQAVQEQADFLKDLIVQISKFTDDVPPSNMAVGADCDGSFSCLRRNSNIVWGETIQVTEKVKEMAKTIKEATTGSALSLKEPDRSDDEWELRHAEYLQKMNEYSDALNHAHTVFNDMQKHYEKYIIPYRQKMWGISS